LAAALMADGLRLVAAALMAGGGFADGGFADGGWRMADGGRWVFEIGGVMFEFKFSIRTLNLKP